MNPRPDGALLAIDCGTQSVRAVVFDAAGDTLARSQVALNGYRAPLPNRQEIDIEAFWTALAQACQALWREHPGLQSSLCAMAVTSQRGTVVPLDASGRALAPAISWMDRRRADRVPALPPLWRALFAAARVDDVIGHLQREAEVNWWAEHETEMLGRADKVMLLSGFLNWRLTGHCADATAAQVGYLPFDYRRQAWCKPSDWRWKALALSPHQCPELVAATRPLGLVRAEAAHETGVPQGLPVIAAGADKACEVLATSALASRVACVSAGTSVSISVETNRYVEALPFAPAYPAAARALYCSEIQTHCGFWMVRWFLDEFGQPERQAAAQRGVAPEAIFDSLAASAPAGAAGLMLQPHWSPGVRHPAADARGSVIGFGPEHGRAHLARAIVEGQAHAMREGRDLLERATRRSIETLVVVGAASRSDLVMQTMADVIGLPALRLQTAEAAALGAAIAASVGAGLHADAGAATSAMARAGQVFRPKAENAALYDRLHREVYQPMYGRLAPLFASLARICARA
ncbi:MAG TPA: FGGY-family carbohydrate kinase [Caldimonas sp.]|nr:FGGY-family carbohydrate kinase [Caldimonas sp.]HEX4236228.1 FGGY-family carbohydrate kinase [Caldimonas sp.]